MAAPPETPAGIGYAWVHPNGFRNCASSACGRVGPQISARFFSKGSDTRADLTRMGMGAVLSPGIWWLGPVKAFARGPGCAPCKLCFVDLAPEIQTVTEATI